MIYDRPYMQNNPRPRQVSVLKWILLSTIGIYILQSLFDRTGVLFNHFALSTEALGSGMIWTVVTYAFLHAPFPLHVIVNMLMVYFAGRALEPLLGAKRFAQLYLVSAGVAGLAWLLVEWVAPTGAPVVGASGAALALLTVFACIYPNKQITLLLFFILPITVRPKYLVFVVLALSLVGLLFFELPRTEGMPIAHSAHLGGMLTGWLFFRYVFSRPERRQARPSVELPLWLKKKPGAGKSSGRFSINLTNRKVLQEEVDRILDKINSQGFGALSEEEKKVLDRAKDLLNK